MIAFLVHHFGDGCIRRAPWSFARGVAIGCLLAGLSLPVISSIMHTMAPNEPPKVRLVSGTIEQGGALAFEALAQPWLSCPENTRRVAIQPLRPGGGLIGPLRIVPLTDTAALGTRYTPGSVVLIPLPEQVAPGDWYYKRYTMAWCTLADLILGPRMIETDPVPFTVIPRGAPPG